MDLTRAVNPPELGTAPRDFIDPYKIYSKFCCIGSPPLLIDPKLLVQPWVGNKLSSEQIEGVVLEAYITLESSLKEPTKILNAPRLDLSKIDGTTLRNFCTLHAAEAGVKDMAAKQYKSAFTSSTLQADGTWKVMNSEFRNKLQRDDVILVTMKNGTEVMGRVAVSEHGKRKTVKLDDKTASTFKEVQVIVPAEFAGHDERGRVTYMQMVLHGEEDPMANRFYRAVFKNFKATCQPPAPSTYSLQPYSLNAAQLTAAQAMLYGENFINLVHGPPGTGKTTLVSAVVAASAHMADHFYVSSWQTLVLFDLTLCIGLERTD